MPHTIRDIEALTVGLAVVVTAQPVISGGGSRTWTGDVSSVDAEGGMFFVQTDEQAQPVSFAFGPHLHITNAKSEADYRAARNERAYHQRQEQYDTGEEGRW